MILYLRHSRNQTRHWGCYLEGILGDVNWWLLTMKYYFQAAGQKTLRVVSYQAHTLQGYGTPGFEMLWGCLTHHNPHATLVHRKTVTSGGTHMLWLDIAQDPTLICLQAISWFLDGGDLEIQATEAWFLKGRMEASPSSPDAYTLCLPSPLHILFTTVISSWAVCISLSSRLWPCRARVANYGSQAKSVLPPVFVNKALLERGRSHSFLYSMAVFLCKCRVEQL